MVLYTICLATHATDFRRKEKEVADGLEAASRGRRELEEANVQREAIVDEAKKEAADLVNQAGQRANQMVEDAKNTGPRGGRQN